MTKKDNDIPEADAVKKEDDAESVEEEFVKEAEKEIDGHDEAKDGHDLEENDIDGHDVEGHDDIDGHDKRKRREEKGRRRQEEASHCQHVPPLRWLPQKSRKEQTQQTPNRARKEEEDPCRTQKAPQHRPSWSRKDPRKGHRILDRLVRPRRREVRHGTKNHQTKIRHQPTPPTRQRK